MLSNLSNAEQFYLILSNIEPILAAPSKNWLHWADGLFSADQFFGQIG